jgi:hypothetical protein
MHNIGPPITSFQVSLSFVDVERLGAALKDSGNLTIQVIVAAPAEVVATANLDRESPITSDTVVSTTPIYTETTEDITPESVEPVVATKRPVGQDVIPPKFEVWLPEDVITPSVAPPLSSPNNEPPAASTDPSDGLRHTAALRERMVVQMTTPTTMAEDAALAQILAANTPWIGPRWREAHNISEEIAESLIARGALIRHPENPDNLGASSQSQSGQS